MKVPPTHQPATVPPRWSLAEASAVRPSPPERFLAWNSVLVVAPHPDDESLGCGGIIALLREANVPVEIAWITDGRCSHPNSRAYPAAKLIALRRDEALAAAAALDVRGVHFFDLEDSRIPRPPRLDVVKRLRTLLSRVQVVLTPWRLDPHGDHRAVFAYVQAAVRQLPILLMEYPVWLWRHGKTEDFPLREDFEVIRIDIEEVLPKKCAAIAAHRSQTTTLITDDPNGFRIPAEMLVHFQQPWELFLLSRDPSKRQAPERS